MNRTLHPSRNLHTPPSPLPATSAHARGDHCGCGGEKKEKAHFVEECRVNTLDLHNDFSPFHVMLLIQTKPGKNRKLQYCSDWHSKGDPLSP